MALMVFFPVARGECFRQDGVTVMVVQDHEVFATLGRSDWKTSGLVSAHFSCKLHLLQVCQLGSDLRLLLRKGRGRHNRRLGDGSGWRSVSS